MSFEQSGYTGGLWEREVLGGNCEGEWTNDRFWSREAALKFAKDHQPKGWRPHDPNSRFANDVHALVAQKLGLEDWADLKLYSALGSPADSFYGVDAFFEYGDTFVTIDLTLDPNKQDYKADYIVHEDSDPEAVADFVAERLKKNRMAA